MILGHRHIDTTLGYARLYGGTLAYDYYAAMRSVAQSLENDGQSIQVAKADLDTLITMFSSICSRANAETQTESATALRNML